VNRLLKRMSVPKSLDHRSHANSWLGSSERSWRMSGPGQPCGRMAKQNTCLDASRVDRAPLD
jgi:hypothetical protein